MINLIRRSRREFEAKTTQKQDLALVKYLKIRTINMVRWTKIINVVGIKYEYK